MSTTELYAIGNAPVDILARVEDTFLLDHHFAKGECSYIELEFLRAVKTQLKAPVYAPGGSAANTASCFSSLGGDAVFTGKTGTDECGTIFRDSLAREQVSYISDGLYAEEETAQILALTTKDTERTFAAYYGASRHISTKDIDKTRLQKSRITFLDAYMLEALKGEDTLVSAAAMAKEAGGRVAFTLADSSIIRDNGQAVEHILRHTHILFGNAREAMAVTGEADEHKAIEKLAGRFELGAITLGARGACVFSGKQIHYAPALTPPKPIVDTNGAGDHYCAGFLYGMNREFPLEKCAQLALLCAAQAITHTGARPAKSLKPLLESVKNGEKALNRS